MKKMRNRMPTLRAYWRGIRVLRPYMPRFFPAIVLHSIVDAVTPYVGLVLCSAFLHAASQGADAAVLWKRAVVAVTVQALFGVTDGLLRRWKESKWECLYRVCDRLVTDRLLTLDYAAFTDESTRRLYRTVHENTQALGRGLVQIPEVVQHLCVGIFGLIAAGLTAWRVFADGWAACGLPLALAAMMIVSVRLSLSARRERASATQDVVMLDRLYYSQMDAMLDPTKAADMRLYRQDRHLLRNLEEIDNTFFGKHGVKHYGHSTVKAALSKAVTAVWLGVAYGLVGMKAATGVFGIGAVVQTVGGLTGWMVHTERLCRGVQLLCSNTPYVRTVLEFLDCPAQQYRGSLTTEKRSDGEYEWEFRHVTFRYPHREEPALCDVSVVLKSGSCTAVVGENGSGKSTFVKLLCRMYDPDEGEILLNGIDIRKYRYEEYIALVSAVFQECCLLPQPLADNVAASANGEEERVRQSLDEAGCLMWAQALPDGLQTPLYSGAFGDGVTPSLGDAQRLAVARALYKRAPLIVFDEPTAALDPLAEAALYEQLDRLTRRHTAVYISHRPASCRFCRDILVFDHGRLVERGTHKDLVSRPAGKYRALWEAGAQYYQ